MMIDTDRAEKQLFSFEKQRQHKWKDSSNLYMAWFTNIHILFLPVYNVL